MATCLMPGKRTQGAMVSFQKGITSSAVCHDRPHAGICWHLPESLTRSTVIAKDSAPGRAVLGTSGAARRRFTEAPVERSRSLFEGPALRYIGSLEGCRGSEALIAGGGMS